MLASINLSDKNIKYSKSNSKSIRFRIKLLKNSNFLLNFNQHCHAILLELWRFLLRLIYIKQFGLNSKNLQISVKSLKKKKHFSPKQYWSGNIKKPSKYQSHVKSLKLVKNIKVLISILSFLILWASTVIKLEYKRIQKEKSFFTLTVCIP